jgi:hypothetical protein
MAPKGLEKAVVAKPQISQLRKNPETREAVDVTLPQILQFGAAIVRKKCLIYRQPKGSYDRGSHFTRLFKK